MRLAFVMLLVLGGCSSQDVPPAPARSTPAAPSASPAGGPVPPLRLESVATVEQPVAIAVLGETLYVAEKTGRVRAIVDGVVGPGAVLDLSGEVSDGNEQGLLGIAFHPDGDRLYVNYTDTRGDTRIVEYAFDAGRATRRRELLRVPQPFSNHNGGHLLFGPDGYLYIFLGDGGSSGDPQNNGQRLDTLLGKILRIDVQPSGARPYSIPPDNPFVGRAGAREEIWAYGLRNPWRASFDRATGDLWIADVGQNATEEINRQPAGSKGGENYGWRALEGTRSFRGTAPRDHVPPVYAYSLTDGNCAIIGGVVYRGSAIPALRGRFLFADHCRGQLFALRDTMGRYRADIVLGPPGRNPTAFGEDAAGEVYVLTREGTVARLVAG